MMFERFGFYARHSLNDLRVNGRRTVFALLCIAAGVAAIVSLQTLAVMIQTTLTGNLQTSNRGDLLVQPGSGFIRGSDDEALDSAVAAGLLNSEEISFFGQTENGYQISLDGVAAIRAWLDENYPDSVVTYRQPLTDPINLFLGSGVGSTLTVETTGEEASQVVPILIESDVYPFYDPVYSTDGTPLADLINEPTDIVLSDTTSQILHASVGDTILISGAEQPFTVSGIVNLNQEVRNPASDALTALFGFYYLDVSAVGLFPDVTPQAERVYIQLANPEQVTAVNAALVQEFPFASTTTTDDLRETYSQIASNIDTLVTVMGLLSMLVGSIGIINTMQVIVRRRTVEIAVLKTVGLQANQVTVLFLVEAVLMGIFGSIIGVVLGWLTVFLIRGAAERLLATDLPFVFAAAPAIRGLIVGIIVTTVFGFLPTLTAGQVRPGLVLRPDAAILPRAGRLRVLMALVLIIAVLTLIAQGILGSFRTALILVVGAFVAAGVLYLMLSFAIWVIGRFLPSFGSVDLKVSLRQMLASRPRAAITLLALVVGVFSLSTITLLSSSITGLLQFALEDASGGNVTISMGSPLQLNNIERVLDETEGVKDYRVMSSYSLELQSVEEPEGTVTLDELGTRLEENNPFDFGGARNADFDMTEILTSQLGQAGVYAPDALPDKTIIRGRQLTAEDVGQPYIVVSDDALLQAAGIDVGDRLVFEVTAGGGLPVIGGSGEAQTITVEIIGMTQQSMMGGGLEPSNYFLEGTLPADVQPGMMVIIANIEPEAISDVRRAVSGTLGVFVIENAAITRLINSLLGTFTAFPTMVATLGLIVGGVVIANSVALTTLERRREIAVMKAVGLQRNRVLFMILLENGLLGLVGGLVGIGLGLIGVIIFASASGAPSSTIPYGTAILLMLLCVAVALVAALSSAWGAAGEKPLNVLRYE